MADESLHQETRRWEEKLGGQGRILIRPSGTEALIRVMVEAKTTEIAHQAASVLADFIKKLWFSSQDTQISQEGLTNYLVKRYNVYGFGYWTSL